jgi:hypothetical protein
MFDNAMSMSTIRLKSVISKSEDSVLFCAITELFVKGITFLFQFAYKKLAKCDQK